MEKKNEAGVMEKAFSRRNFAKGAATAGLGAVGAMVLGGKMGVLDKMPGAAALGLTSSAVSAQAITDADILNFALNLEYLEAEFYTVVTTGKTIEEIGIGVSGTGTSGPTTGGHKVNFREGFFWLGDFDAGVTMAIAEELAYDEQQHVLLLRSALGSAAVAKPAINLDALGIGFANYREYLQLARAFEDVGVSAYAGAAPLISSKSYLQVAAQILATEALHSGNIRKQVQGHEIPTMPVDSLDVLPPPSGKRWFTVNQQALAIIRTTSQVLKIVYGGGTSSGGFFPNGVNGTINTAS
jgi:Ferritin-like domain